MKGTLYGRVRLPGQRVMCAEVLRRRAAQTHLGAAAVALGGWAPPMAARLGRLAKVCYLQAVLRRQQLEAGLDVSSGSGRRIIGQKDVDQMVKQRLF
jgi:hypothetical protein